MAEPLRGDAADRVGRVTIIDVARRAGVSRSTASLVLSGGPLVAEATTWHVHGAMRALGRVYRRGAASLRAASSGLAGMIMSDLKSLFFVAELGALTTVTADTPKPGTRCAEGVLGLVRREGPSGLSFAGDARLIVRESRGAKFKRGRTA